MRSFLVAVVLGLIFLQIAEGQSITYLSENRFVLSEISEVVDIDQTGQIFETTTTTDSANGFGSFSSELLDEFTPRVFASQTSALTFNSLTATATVDGFGANSSGEIGSRMVDGTANFEAVFDLSEPTSYSLNFLEGGFVEFGNFSVTGPSLNINENIGVFGRFDDLSLSQSGVLEAGTYEFNIQINNGSTAEGMAGSFDFDFQISTVPEPSSSLALLAIVLLASTKRQRN